MALAFLPVTPLGAAEKPPEQQQAAAYPPRQTAAVNAAEQPSLTHASLHSSLLDKPARLDVKDVSLTKALVTLRRRAEVNIVFSPSLLPQDKRVSCSCMRATVEEALNAILEDTGFEHLEMAMQIVIRAPEPLTPQLPITRPSSYGPPSFAFASLSRATIGPRSPPHVLVDSVMGIVIDASSGQPLSNAVVTVMGTSRSALTNAQGRFLITGLESLGLTSVTLQARVIGYAAGSATASLGAGNIEIALQPSAVALDAIVVSALGIERERRALGYSVATVSPEEMTVNRTPNFMDALQGKIAGVAITTLGTGPQGSSKVRIRGQSSFGGNNSPLIVVNGVPIDNTSFGVSGDVGERGSNRNSDSGDGLSSINPDDIVDMSVLKGAAAAALYGSRAKDGVIIITTRKSGQGSGIQWSYTGNITSERPLDFRDYQMEYGQGEGGVRPQGSDVQDSGVWSFGEKFQPGMTQELFGVEIPYEPQPNQFDQYYRNGLNYSNTLMVSHGSDNGGVSASLSRLNTQAILPTSDYNRTTFNLGFTQQVASRYNISGNVNYSHEDRDNPPNIAEQDYSPVVIYTLATSMPMSFLEEMAMNEEGDERRWSRFTNRTNPYFALTRFENNIRDRVYGNLTGRVDLTSWLFAQGRLGQDFYSRDQEYNLPTGSTRQPPAPPGFVNGQYVQDQLRFREINADFLIGGSGDYGLIGLAANVGGNLMRRKSERNSVLVQDFFARGAYNLSNGRLLDPDHSLSERQVNSLYGQAELSFRNLAFLTGTLRNDWFSTLSPQNRSILYPSLAASFVFTDAVRAPEWLTFGKLRAAYAEVGSDTDVPPYADNLFYSINSNFFRDRPLGAISGGTVPNPNLRPMRLSEWELGVEMRLLDNVTLDLGYYQRTSRDQILNQQISSSSGFTSRRVNIGASRNHGVEWLVDFSPVRTERFGWNASFNGSYNQSEVLNLGTDIGVDQITVGGADFHGELRQVTGQPLNQLYGIGWLKDAQGRQVFNPNTGAPVPTDDEIPLGSALPVWVGGITNDFNYGDLSMSFLVDFKLGHKLISGTYMNALRHGLDKATLVGREAGCVVGDGVLPDGSVNTICTPVQQFYEATRTYRTSEESVFNAGSWQLRQISIGYDLTDIVPAGSRISAMSVNLVANNVAVLKKWVPHIHPDQNGIYGDNRMGLEATGLPVTRGLGLNLNVRF
jgi:TonB-linked SusC/RagA family outer membrane protein